MSWDVQVIREEMTESVKRKSGIESVYLGQQPHHRQNLLQSGSASASSLLSATQQQQQQLQLAASINTANRPQIVSEILKFEYYKIIVSVISQHSDRLCRKRAAIFCSGSIQY